MNGSQSKLSNEDIQEVRQLRAEGASLRELGKRFSVSHETIRLHLLGNDPKPKKPEIPAGTRFGHLQVMKYSQERGLRGARSVWCECDCQNLLCVTEKKLRNGDRKTCGMCDYTRLRPGKPVTIKGVTKKVCDWMKESSLSEHTIRMRRYRGMSLEDALTRPLYYNYRGETND